MDKETNDPAEAKDAPESTGLEASSQDSTDLSDLG